MRIWERKQRNIPKNSTDIAMRIVACPRGVADFFSFGIPDALALPLHICYSDHQHNFFFMGKGSNFTIPSCKPTNVRF